MHMESGQIEICRVWALRRATVRRNIHTSSKGDYWLPGCGIEKLAGVPVHMLFRLQKLECRTLKELLRFISR